MSRISFTILNTPSFHSSHTNISMSIRTNITASMKAFKSIYINFLIKISIYTSNSKLSTLSFMNKISPKSLLITISMCSSIVLITSGWMNRITTTMVVCGTFWTSSRNGGNFNSINKFIGFSFDFISSACSSSFYHLIHISASKSLFSPIIVLSDVNHFMSN